MQKEVRSRSDVQSVLSLLTVVVGAVLLIYMVRVESEPGAIPLLLVISGTVWYLVARFSFGSGRRSGRHSSK
ncbi:MAG: hypothetical protein ACOCTG_01810 [Bacteroidota bacterium]